MRKIFIYGLVLILFVSIGKNTSAQEADNSKEYYSFGGHVFSGDFPIELGYAYLYDYNDLSTRIDLSIIDTLGYYYFYQVPQGKYLVYAGLALEDPNYGQFSYTFYPNASYWEDADAIDLKETGWEYDIHLVNLDPEQQIQGPGTISGTIIIPNGKPFAKGVDVMLCNDQMEPLQHWPTNSQGEFFFNNLEYGNYILYPQITGLTTKPIYITISEDQYEHSDIEITIKNGFISSFINEELVNNNTFLCFPNPASSQLNMSFETYAVGQITSRVYDLQGRIVYEQNQTSSQGMNYQVINTSNLSNGYYFIDISLDDKTAVKYKFAVVH